MENIKNVPNHRPDTYVHVYLIESMYYLIGEITYIYIYIYTYAYGSLNRLKLFNVKSIVILYPTIPNHSIFNYI